MVGGCFECLVVTYPELEEVLLDCETAMNNRPLLELSKESNSHNLHLAEQTVKSNILNILRGIVSKEAVVLHQDPPVGSENEYLILSTELIELIR